MDSLDSDDGQQRIRVRVILRIHAEEVVDDPEEDNLYMGELINKLDVSFYIIIIFSV